jgi:hypothetical protein
MTVLLSIVSPIYLLPNGAYCFFGFSSYAIAGWLLPGLVMTLGVMTFCYYKIWQHFRQNTLFLETSVKISRQASQPIIHDNGVEMTDLKISVKISMPESQTIIPENVAEISDDSNISTRGSQPEHVQDIPTLKNSKDTGTSASTLQVPTLKNSKNTSTSASALQIPTLKNSKDTSTSASALPVVEHRKKQISHLRVARRSALFIGILLLGWGFAAVTAIYELTVGPATEWLVTTVGVGAVSFSWWVPIVYALTSKFHKKTMKKLFWMCIPCRGAREWKESSKRTSSPECSLSNDNSLRSVSSRVPSGSASVHLGNVGAVQEVSPISTGVSSSTSTVINVD